MALITSLPEELLFVIFNNLNNLNGLNDFNYLNFRSNLNSLAECRLTCKAWSAPAERAMLGSIVPISSNGPKTRSLYEVLKKNPEKAYLIKHLKFFNFKPFPEDCISDLLQIALSSPNVESIIGMVAQDDFIDTLTDIVERSPNKKLDRLQTLTLSSRNFKSPLRLALHCKSTIQTMELRFLSVKSRIDWTFVDKLNEFTNLTWLKLLAEIGTITNLDRILSKCSQLQKLTLVSTGWEGALDWDQQRTERNTNLKILSIPDGFDCPTQVLEYLLYKYPNIERASVDARFVGEEYILQVPRLLQRVPQRKLFYSISDDDDIRFILKRLINFTPYKITLEKPAPHSADIRIKVDY